MKFWRWRFINKDGEEVKTNYLDESFRDVSSMKQWTNHDLRDDNIVTTIKIQSTEITLGDFFDEQLEDEDGLFEEFKTNRNKVCSVCLTSQIMDLLFLSELPRLELLGVISYIKDDLVNAIESEIEDTPEDCCDDDNKCNI